MQPGRLSAGLLQMSPITFDHHWPVACAGLYIRLHIRYDLSNTGLAVACPAFLLLHKDKVLPAFAACCHYLRGL